MSTRHESERALPSWADGATRDAIIGFVASVTEGPGAVPVEERIARKGGGFALLVHHDDSGRGDTPYDKGAEQALAAASLRHAQDGRQAQDGADRGITVVSVARDWSRIFPDPAM